jgi:DNA-binding NtrC family response regulator
LLPDKAVLLVGREHEWPAELRARLRDDGYATNSVEDLALVPSRLSGGSVGALFVYARPLGASELLALRRVREASPHTAIVVITRTPTDPDLKRAFESGATAFLSWPASPEALRHAVESGEAPVEPTSHTRDIDTRSPHGGSLGDRRR